MMPWYVRQIFSTIKLVRIYAHFGNFERPLPLNPMSIFGTHKSRVPRDNPPEADKLWIFIGNPHKAGSENLPLSKP
jgi:hypothetical protein